MRRWALSAPVAWLVLSGCRGPAAEVQSTDQTQAGAQADAQAEASALDLRDDPRAFIEDSRYRRAVLERDLVDPEPIYARVRLRRYSRADDHGWDRLPVREWPSLPLSLEAAASLAATRRLPELEFGPRLSAPFGPEHAPAELPATQAEWIELGERVFFELPMTVAPTVGRALRANVDLRDYGFLVHEGSYVGLRFADVKGQTRVVTTCASCHASVDADGRLSGIRANRAYDFGRLRLDHGGARETQLVDMTQAEDLHRLGPGRSDVQRDEVFNPYAFPDFGGIVDMPYLHHTANWHQRGVASLAIRVETVYTTGGQSGSRPPRVLMWALAEYLRSLPPPAPVSAPSPASERGRVVFMGAGCDACHTPPLFTSPERPSLDEIGTDESAGRSPIRGTGTWRVPSLRGVGGNAPYLHHGAVTTLEALFDPAREEPGHRFGLELEPVERSELIAFLNTI